MGKRSLIAFAAPLRKNFFYLKSRKAFTLVELLIAVAILVIVSGSAMLIFRSTTRAWQNGQIKTQRYQQARLLFDLFSRELNSCIANSRFPLIGHASQEGFKIRLESTQSEIFFVGTLPGRSGLVERGWWVDSNGNMVCHDQEPADGDYLTGGSDEVCGSDISGFEVSFFDGSKWLGQWDGREGKDNAGMIPRAIRLLLKVGSKNPEQFETLIYLPISEPNAS